MNYDSMTDFEINIAVAKVLGYLVKTEFEKGPMGFTEKYHAEYPNTIWAARTENGRQCDYWEQTNFCSHPEHAWPIIEENKIAVMPDSDNTWKAGSLPAKMVVGWANFTRGQSKPLRAAMIVFLKMKEAEQ